MTIEEMREIYDAATRTDTPPPDCELKEISPNVFAWVKCTNDGDSDTTE